MPSKSQIKQGTVELSKKDQKKYDKWLIDDKEQISHDLDNLEKLSLEYDHIKEMASLTLNLTNIFETFKKFKNKNSRAKLDNLKKQLNRTKNLGEKQDLTKQYVDLEKEMSEEDLSTLKHLLLAKQLTSSVKKFYNVALKTFDVLGMDIKNIFKDVINNIAENLSRTGMASYDTTTSLFTNSEARSQAMKYGISSSTNWALTKTAGMLFGGTGNLDENIAYMNPAQKEMFATLMSKYSSWYDQLQSTGVLQRIQEFQLDFAMLKEELAIDFMNWFAQNKEIVLGAITGTFSVIKAISSVIVGIANFLGGVKSSDSVLNGSKAITVNISNTNNNSLSNTSQLAIAQNISDTTIKSVARAIEAW